MKIKFGTEGWRAVIAEEFTADNVRIVSQAIAEHMRERSKGQRQTIAVGYDTRFLSDHFARAVAEVLAANGFNVVFSKGTVPTCAVSRYVVDKKLPLGIMVTASHNPGTYNGLKVKEAYGGSATSETVASIEGRLGKNPVQRTAFDDASKSGKISPDDFLPLYLKGLKSFVNIPAIKRSKLKVIVDSMHGVGGGIIESLLKGGNCRVQTLHAERDPLFGGQAPEPIASNLTELSRTVKRMKAHVGIANDGDADRLGIVGPGGQWLNPGQVMCILLTHLVNTRGASGVVVKTVSNTMMINRLTEALGLKLVEVPVGFKYVVKLMQEGNVLVGGEESGGIGLKGYLPERDGILNGLMLLEAMAVQGKGLDAMMREFTKQFGQWYYGRRDLHLKMEQVDTLFEKLKHSPPDKIAGVPVRSVNRLDGVKLIGGDESWLLFRRSGTEPIVRIYAETPKKSNLNTLLDLGVQLTK